MMGQYYLTVNVSKKQYLNPHKFGDGLKLMEFGMSGHGTLMGLAALLDANHRGTPESWAFQRIVVSGDYADEGRFGAPPDVGLYAACRGQENEDMPGSISSEYADVSAIARQRVVEQTNGKLHSRGPCNPNEGAAEQAPDSLFARNPLVHSIRELLALLGLSEGLDPSGFQDAKQFGRDLGCGFHYATLDEPAVVSNSTWKTVFRAQGLGDVDAAGHYACLWVSRSDSVTGLSTERTYRFPVRFNELAELFTAKSSDWPPKGKALK